MTESCRRGHPYSPENTYTYKNGSRDCRVCRRLRAATATVEMQTLTCPDCGETRRIEAKQRYRKKYPAEVCGPCAVRRSNGTRGLPTPLPVEVLGSDDWRLPEERLSPRLWAERALRDDPGLRAALRWLPVPETERTAA